MPYAAYDHVLKIQGQLSKNDIFIGTLLKI